jgi:nifR3 family TIM-barrel protein
MASSEGFVRRNRESRRLLSVSADDPPVCVQIFGGDPSRMAAAAKAACETGATQVDINAGCPARKVMSSGGGAALVREPSQLARIVEAVAGAVPVPVTVKTRIGWNHGDDTYLEIGRLVTEAGASAITLHARTVTQGFSGTADWSKIRALAGTLRIPVIGNGDVREPADALRMLDETGCAGVMIGRGAVGNPWIFRRLSEIASGGKDPGPPTVEETKETAVRHLREARGYYGDHASAVMKKHLVRYTRGLPGGAEIRARICAAESVEEEEEILAAIAGDGEKPE